MYIDKQKLYEALMRRYEEVLKQRQKEEIEILIKKIERLNENNI